MTGRYSVRYGMQYGIIVSGAPWSLPFAEKVRLPRWLIFGCRLEREGDEEVYTIFPFRFTDSSLHVYGNAATAVCRNFVGVLFYRTSIPVFSFFVQMGRPRDCIVLAR